MDKLRIMFVDDESNVLDGLRRLFRSMRNEWELAFAGSGEQALEMMEAQPYDVVVSDMKMPNINGAELLTQIKHRHPASIRIVLSGHSDPHLTMQAVGPTHQFLAKPCDPDELKATIARVTALKKMLASDTLSGIVSGIDALPSLPEVYSEILACLEDPDASLEQVAEIVGKDVGMTAKLLQLSNSAFFGIGRTILSIDEAVSFLGLETITTLAMGYGVFAHCDEISSDVLDIRQLWDYSIRSSAIVKKIAKLEDMNARQCNEAGMAGMLHDIGRLVLALGEPELCRECSDQQDDPYGFDDTVVRRALGTTQAGLGAYLLGLWGLPERVVEAVAFHDEPGHADGSQFDVLGVVHVGSRLAADPEAEDPAEPVLHTDLNYLEETGVIDRWPAWQAVAAETLLAQEEAA